MCREIMFSKAGHLIVHHEGIRHKPYYCPAGHLTIGVGHNLEAQPLTIDQIAVIFEGRVEEVQEVKARSGDAGMKNLLESALNEGISDAAILKIFKDDVAHFKSDLSRNIPWWSDLSEPRSAVLLDMAFNMGIGGLLKFKKTLSLIEQGEYVDASIEMLSSRWARQVPTRANRLSEMMRNDKWPREVDGIGD
jgi:lysozyme